MIDDHGTGHTPQDGPQRLRIETFGHFTVRYGDRDVVLNGRKSRALLGYLALSESGEETRERLVGLLWSETDETRARASLRQALYEIREALKAVGFDKFDADKHATRIDRNILDVDLWEVMAGAKRGEPHPILLNSERATESLLRELEAVDPSFRSWLLAKRQSLHDRLVAHLEDVLRGQADGGAAGNEERIARALMKLDPTHEEAARALIRARVAAGDIGGALGIYKALWDLLDNEYEVEPSRETQELIAAVKMGEPSGVAAPEVGLAPPVARPGTELAALGSGVPAKSEGGPHPRGRARKLVMSIGGFDAAGVREGHRYLVQGFRHELTASLVRFREWSVRDQGHASAGAAPSVRDEGEYIIDASGFDTGDGVRLILMLRDAATNDYVWSERLQLSLDGWFDAQQSVVRRLATALNVHISAERLASLAHNRPNDLGAFDLWLRGHALLLNFSPKEWHEALGVFQQAIAEAPSFAPAYVSLANAQNIIHIVHPGVARDRRRTEAALSYARIAARLDPIDSRAQLCLGWSTAMANEFNLAETHLNLAYELNENDPWTALSSATCLAFCGSTERALDMAHRVLQLPIAPSPLQWSYHATIRFLSSDYLGCIHAADLARNANPNVLGFKVAGLSHLGRTDDARQEFKLFVDRASSRWFGQSASSAEQVARWFLDLFPIKSDVDWLRLRDGLAGAGAPVETLTRAQ
jgi:DNA-binding SARP family transcriptional activator/TolB-like protein